jgi:hypothetical protein
LETPINETAGQSGEVWGMNDNPYQSPQSDLTPPDLAPLDLMPPQARSIEQPLESGINARFSVLTLLGLMTWVAINAAAYTQQSHVLPFAALLSNAYLLAAVYMDAASQRRGDWIAMCQGMLMIVALFLAVPLLMMVLATLSRQKGEV